MRFSGVSALAIWNNAVRNLTGFGGALNQNQAVNVVLGATSTVSFATAAGNAAILTIGVVANAGGTILIQFTDGTNTWTAQTIAISTTGGQDFSIGSNTVAWQVHNNSASAAAYFFSGVLMTH